MSNILVVLGSARPGRVADSVLTLVQKDLQARDDATVTVADLKELALPFFDAPVPAMSPDFTITNENVQKWADLVEAADGVVLLMPEYNHSMTAIQKNAIDWLYAQWENKPVAVVSYGWSGGSLALVTAKEVLGNVKANLLPTVSQLAFMQQLNPDGSVLDADATSTAIAATLDELTDTIEA